MRFFYPESGNEKPDKLVPAVICTRTNQRQNFQIKMFAWVTIFSTVRSTSRPGSGGKSISSQVYSKSIIKPESYSSPVRLVRHY